SYAMRVVRCLALLIYMSSLLDMVRGRFRLECTENLHCTEADRRRWSEKKFLVQKLMQLAAIAETDRYILRSSPLLDALKYRHELCNDHHNTGFLLSNESDHEWSVACMWTGGEISASCALAPIGNKPIDFIEGYEWRKMLYTFRKTIGCSNEEIQAVNNVSL
uniref:SCP domain-containing protein n=1 Tax=Parascaris univalens TaxID=6257 RepID=A0A915CGT6_PARUN